MAKFPGFSPKVLTFFRQLEKNNDRTWFAARKEFYQEEVRGPMIQLVGQLMGDLRKFAPDYLPEKPEKAVYRIYRDTRFSKDKTPYKTNISAFFQYRKIPKYRGAGFYFEISHEGLGVAGGMYMPDPEQLAAVRQALAKDDSEFARLCADRKLTKLFGELQGGSVARVPKGFDPQSPAADFLKRKQFYFYTELEAKIALTPRVHKEILTRFERAFPMIQWLNNAVMAAMTEDEEEPRPVRPEPMF